MKELTLWPDLPGGSIGSHTSLKSGKTCFFLWHTRKNISLCAFSLTSLCGVFQENTYLGGSLVGAILQTNHALASL